MIFHSIQMDTVGASNLLMIMYLVYDATTLCGLKVIVRVENPSGTYRIELIPYYMMMLIF